MDEQEQEQEHGARAALTRLAEREAPPLGFTADGLAARGRRARTRRIRAVAGGALGVAAVAVAVLPGVVTRGSGAVGPATQAVDPTCAADVDRLARAEGPAPQAGADTVLRACPVVRRVTAILDPTGGHLRAVDRFLKPAPTDVGHVTQLSAATGEALAMTMSGMWTADGHYAVSPTHTTFPYGIATQVDVIVQAPGTAEPYSDGVYDHLAHPDMKPGQILQPVPWTPVSLTTLRDGSTVSVRGEHDANGSAYLVIRTLRSGVRLVVFADGPMGTGAAGTPFPFTTAQLVAAVSVPWDGEVGLSMYGSAGLGMSTAPASAGGASGAAGG